MVVWFVIKFDASIPRTQTLTFTVPVLALSGPTGRGVWHLTPPEATVRVRAAVGIVVEMEDVVAFVNLAGVDASADANQSRRILVEVPDRVEVIRVDPPSVLAQYSTLPGDGRTNRVNGP